jgi:hypothetical protein
MSPCVIGHHPFDLADAVRGYIRGGVQQEWRSGGALLVWQDLGVSEARVIVGQRVDIVIADRGLVDARR